MTARDGKVQNIAQLKIVVMFLCCASGGEWATDISALAPTKFYEEKAVRRAEGLTIYAGE